MPILTELNLYPIKSCAGIALREATITPAGLMTDHIYDREWMVVDAQGKFMTQRQHPKMALIVPRLKADTLELRAPGMLRLEIPLDLPAPEDARTRDVQVWDNQVTAYDCDETTATWFSNFLGTPCRLVRFHPDAARCASTEWTGEQEAPTLFSDGFPVLVLSEASLADLNDKLEARGRDRLPMNRFRPNIVVSGIDAFDEDFTETLTIGTAVLKPVKPCARCSIPAIEQSSGISGPDPLDILRDYRVNPKVNGGITFGMNAIVLQGEGQVLRVGQEVRATLAF